MSDTYWVIATLRIKAETKERADEIASFLRSYFDIEADVDYEWKKVEVIDELSSEAEEEEAVSDDESGT